MLSIEDLVNVRNSVQDGFLRIEVEWCVEEMIQKVEEDAERTPRHVARRLFEGDEEEDASTPSDSEVLEELQRVGERMWEEWNENTGADEEHPGGEGVCDSCGLCHWQIRDRCTNTYGFSIDYLIMRESGMITCQSCMCDGVKCIECGVSQKLVRTIYDRDTEFIREEGTFPPIHRCHECQGSHEIYLNSAREGDNPEEESSIPPELQETYNGEFEIDTEGDETLLEGEDDEDTKKTKEIMKGVMDDMFGVTEDIPESTYMNIVNKMKEVYDRL
tara:strand:+ start:1039 stop:1860 length:822 start_codon:yes stop_codon:yes gene_type:complete